MITRRNCLLALSAGMTASAASSAPGAGTPEALPLRLRLSSSTSNERGKVLRLEDFHLVITNHSSERLAVWREWCSWGWFCPAVSIQLGETTFEFKKAEKCWTRNFPDPFSIDPGEHFVLPVNLLSDDWIQPKGFQPEANAGAVVTAAYTIKPEEEATKMKVWTGTLKCQMKMILDAFRRPRPQ